ncbi:hypothetical protein [Streptomyces cinnamoneus]|uniref:hypothetical protein n=1 Tax=Streptomyces cinnamoneus TaxID=53446 RepID=UPI00378CDE31
MTRVAPELPAALGAGFRAAFIAWARTHPLRGNARTDAAAFTAHLRAGDTPVDAPAGPRRPRFPARLLRRGGR